MYRSHGLEMVNFPPNSGDLNPIENVWAKLRLDLAKMEQNDLSQKPPRFLTTTAFKIRVSGLLSSYGQIQPGQDKSYLQKLVHGMPARLAKCRRNLFGRCGK